MLLKLSLENKLNMGREFQKELSPLTDEKEIALFFKNCGGEKIVQSYIRLVQWWDNLTEDWQHKILNAPFKFVHENLWFKLSHLSLEGLQQWYDDIIERSHKSSKNNGSQTLSPNIWNKVVSNILPSPKRIKRVLKLHESVTEEDFNVLLHQKNYNFTPESLEEFIAQVRQGVKEQPIVTENLFPFLKDRGLDPLLLLSPRDRNRFELEEKLKEKDKEIEQMRSQFEQKLEQRDQRIAELEQRDQQKQAQITQQQSEIEELKQQNQDILEQMKEIMKRLPSLQPV